ncbi:Com family DNA-binding transcriptional regulator [Paenacidovorax caeni]|uniref:Com family DNA-binding transcriptional regulator n=1 Tax=Paenacidovorax caeni TaxID=343013 RepID=UPI0009EAEFD1|nr:Com family DNA-binding transcriptional regulator [Paenacidovorax caeni]
MEEIRCGACGRKLGEGIFARLAIKCPRCGTLNQFQSATSASLSERQPSVQPLKRSNDESNFSHIHPARPGHDPQRRAQSLPG